MTDPLDRRPALARSVRLSHDHVRGRWVLLAPELVVELDEPGLAVMRLIDGRPIRAIAAELARVYAAPEDILREDVLSVIEQLDGRGLLARDAP